MTSLTEVLRQYAPQIDEAEFLHDLRDKLAAARHSADVGLTESEVRFLTDHGGPEGRAVMSDRDPAARSRRRHEVAATGVQDVWAGTLSAPEAAELLGKGRPQISRDLKNGKLFGVRVGTQWRLPLWQFADGAAVPGLATVVPRIPPSLHPLAVQGFMTTPQDELDDRTPLAHLRSGGDPTVVAELVDGLDR